MTPCRALLLALPLACAAAVSAQQIVQAPRSYDDPADIQRALTDARTQGQAAQARAEKLEAEAARANADAEKTASTAAAIAARIQQAESQILAQRARIGLIDRQRENLRARLAERQRPLVRLTAALQRLSRRPPALSLFRPGSVSDTMHMRAILETMMPEVARRTAALRTEIERGRQLQDQARLAERGLVRLQGDLHGRRQALVALETRQRLASRSAGGVADREAERALALAEQARDLDGLADGVAKAGELREELARLPGPVMRPARPEDSQVATVEAPASPAAELSAYIMPAAGRLVAGFGESADGAPRSRGITLATQPGAQAVAPAPGRVVFAGRYQGYGQIVIIEHPGGWTSLVTGLARLDVNVGETLVAGSPLGVAGVGDPRLTLELRRGGEPVNPLDHMRAL
jgi:septal ring factor EnvC (AmiA/AmiB activator)